MNDEKYFPALIVAAYNRPSSLQRLLLSLEHAQYPEADVTLVISIDKDDNQDVLRVAEISRWTHGEKRIIRQQEHQGLKQHLLGCGDLTAEYGSIVLLEDDLLASKYFYRYAQQALNFYADDSRIAGISLYAYDMAENGFNPFVPVDDGHDVYFMQVASSWGQCWTAAQWQAFRDWFQQNPEMSTDELLPPYLFNWHENSWKKHFIRYLHHQNKFFVFPRHSLTTNFEEPGATASTKGLYQVPLLTAARDFRLAKLSESKSVYDAFFEMRADCLKKWCPFLQDFDFTVDLYGTLPLSHCRTPYLLTLKKATDAVFAFALEMFPAVLNVIHDLRGEQISLAKKENILSAEIASDANYYKFKPVSEIIFQDELVQRVEKVYAHYSVKMDELHKSYTESIEGLHAELRQLHENYHRQIGQLHDAYAVKIKSAVDAALKDYQFKLDHPLFAIVTVVSREKFQQALTSAKSVLNQDYPRISCKVIVVGNAQGMDFAEFADNPNVSIEAAGTISAAIQAAETHFNSPESAYHCWLEAGTLLLPKSLMTVNEIFKRFAEVNWLKGLPLSLGTAGEIIPASNGIDFRWDKHTFYGSALAQIGSSLSRSAVFWKKHLWNKAGGNFNLAFPHIPDIEYFSRLFSIDQLYVVMANLAASNSAYTPAAEAQKEFDVLAESFPKRSAVRNLTSLLFHPFFKRDIPVLRAVSKSQHAYPPLIRFDYQSQSFYLSAY